MGIAFDYKNNASGKSGITLALVERNHPGLIQDTHHNPLNLVSLMELLKELL